MIIKNHLFLKITDGKPPFIGVGFEREAEKFAGNTNTDLLEVKNPMFTLYIENNRGLIRLVLRMEDRYQLICYDHLRCNWADLTRWIELCSKAEAINFGHVVRHEFGHAVAKTSKGKYFYFPIKKIFYDVHQGNSKESIITTISRH